jgi:hypothetical protein
MAYIGNIAADKSSGSRPRDDFIGDGISDTFLLSQGVPGGFESNIQVFVDNVPQQPIEAYRLIQLQRIVLTGISRTFVYGETLEQITTGARGRIVNAPTNSGFVDVVQTTSTNFSVGQIAAGLTSTAFGTISELQTLDGFGLQFTGIPDSGQVIYAIHQGGETYQLSPSAGSIIPSTLSDNLRNFVIDKFTATSGQTTFTLSQSEVSANTLLVIVNGSVKTAIDDYTLGSNGGAVVFGSAMSGSEKVVIVHLSFSTVSRHALQETGTFTPQLKFGGANVGLSASTVSGTYTKTGRLVTANIFIRLVQTGTSTGIATITGLPYESFGVSDQNFPHSLDEVNTLDGMPIVRLAPSSTTLQLGRLRFADGRWQTIDQTILSNSSAISLTFTYIAAK